MALRLGINLGYWGPDTVNDAGTMRALAVTADRLGYDVAWVAEAYGSAAPTVLGWLAGLTERMALGTAVMQIPARSPAMTAMTAATLDVLCEGRFRLGLGVSGPQVSEGWHGVRFGSPLGRTREYVDIVRMALTRERVSYQGDHYILPLPDGPGKPLKLTISPVQERIPLYLAAVGPKNLELAGEIADGWLGIFVSPSELPGSIQAIAAGCARAGRDPSAVDLVANTPIVIGPDVAECADLLRAHYALYIGGMGARDKNFYHQLATKLGFGTAADEVQDLFLQRRHRDAAAAVPVELIDETALLGPVRRIGTRMAAYAAAGLTTLALSTTEPAVLEPAWQAARDAGLLEE